VRGIVEIDQNRDHDIDEIGGKNLGGLEVTMEEFEQGQVKEECARVLRREEKVEGRSKLVREVVWVRKPEKSGI
jgi:hypothetical protein